MKIAIVGPGAMGSLFAAFLARSGQDVSIFDKRKERAAYLNKNGLKVEGISGEFKTPIKATVNPQDLKGSDLIIVCVKSYDTKKATEEIKTVAGGDVLNLTLQNGVGNVETISSIVGEDRTIGGVTSHGATLLGDGHIRHAGKGETVIGSAHRTSSGDSSLYLAKITQAFTKAGFETRTVDNIQDLIWSKLIINVGINALTGITHLNNGRLIEFEGTDAILEAAVKEALKVAKKKGINIIFDDPIKKVKDVCKATAGNVASMLQDVLRSRKTEIDSINGAIVKEAKNLKIDVPVNRVLTDLIKSIESSYELRVRSI